MTILYIIIHFTRFRRFSCFTGVTITNIATNWNILVEKRKTETIRTESPYFMWQIERDGGRKIRQGSS